MALRVEVDSTIAACQKGEGRLNGTSRRLCTDIPGSRSGPMCSWKAWVRTSLVVQRTNGTWGRSHHCYLTLWNNDFDRGTALKQLFEALLDRKSEKRAESVFHTAQDYLQKHGLTEQLIDLYMAAFDHYWNGNRELRFIALQAYVSAFLAAAADPEYEEHLGKIIGNTMLKLTHPETAPSLTQLEWITIQLKNWLTDQFGEVEQISTLMHPVYYAEKLIPFNKDPVKYLNEHERLFAEYTD